MEEVGRAGQNSPLPLWTRPSWGGGVPSRARLTGAAPAVLLQPEAGRAGALEGAGQVGAVVLAAAEAGRALVHVCGHTGLLGRGPPPTLPLAPGPEALPPSLPPQVQRRGTPAP